LPRGKTLGGTSSINGMVYIRGHPADFDDWAAMGNPGWSYREVLPYFIRSEANTTWTSSPYHGTDGPMCVSDVSRRNPLVERFVDSARSLGFGHCRDFNGASMEGFGPRQATIRHGRRESMATAYLHPVRNRTNLIVLTECLAQRLVIESGRVTALELESGGTRHTIQATREVVLCAGAFGSPALLMHSGIGAQDELRDHGIPPQHHLPGVGQNLQDHLSTTVMMRTRDTDSYGVSWRTLPRALWNLCEYFIARRGPLGSNVFEAHGFVRTQPELDRPDLQVIFVPAHRNPSGFPIPVGHGYGINVALLRPRSRGTLKLAGPDPRTAPLIDPRFLSDPADLPPLIAGLKLARRILADTSFKSLHGREIAPGTAVSDDAGLEEYVRRTCGTVFHPCGTCRMGSDEQSVVDPELRVRGLEGLRVADASIFPRIITGNTNAAAVMVAEKAADLILGRPAPPIVSPKILEHAE
jgi:choline dehydrogenase